MSAEKNWQFELEEYICTWTVWMIISKVSVLKYIPKPQFDTLECTLEELAILKLLYKNPSIKQKELVAETGKSLNTVKRIMESLQKKDYIRRVDGKRYEKWKVLI